MVYNYEVDLKLQNDPGYPLNIKEVSDLIARAEEYGALNKEEIRPFVKKIMNGKGEATDQQWREAKVLAAAARLKNAADLIAEAEEHGGPLTEKEIKPYAEEVWRGKKSPKNQTPREMRRDWNKGKILAAEARLKA